MSDLEKYITKRKEADAKFAKDYDKEFEDFKSNKTLAKVDWEKSREILAKVLDVEAKDFDKL